MRGISDAFAARPGAMVFSDDDFAESNDDSLFALLDHYLLSDHRGRNRITAAADVNKAFKTNFALAPRCQAILRRSAKRNQLFFFRTTQSAAAWSSRESGD